MKNIKYAGIIENDVIDGEGVCVSFWTQGCPIRCRGCHNPHTWNFDEGLEEDRDILLKTIIELINKNGVQRNLSILGGEPLCEENRGFVAALVIGAKYIYPDIKIFLWTGYTLDEFKDTNDTYITLILNEVDYIIDGPFIEEQKDITLKWRGSRNQRILTKEEIKKIIVGT